MMVLIGLLLAVVVGMGGGLVAGWFLGYQEQVIELVGKLRFWEKKPENGYDLEYKPTVQPTTVAEDLKTGMDEVKKIGDFDFK